MASIDEKRQQRVAFMRALYGASGGDEGMDLDPYAIAESVEIPAADRPALISFLEDHQLITEDCNNASGTARLVQIAHPGVLQVEEAMSAVEAAKRDERAGRVALHTRRATSTPRLSAQRQLWCQPIAATDESERVLHGPRRRWRIAAWQI
jgi:hypothetical protein